MVDVRIGARLPVAREGLLQRRRGSRRAQARVAVDVVGAEATVGDDAQGVVLLGEQLAGGVETDRAGPLLLKQILRATDHPIHRGVPVRLDKFSALADEGSCQPVRRRVRLPAKEVLRAEPPVIDPVHGTPAHSGDPTILHGDVEGVTIRMQNRGRLHPPVHRLRGQTLFQVRVHPHGPVLTWPVRRARSPRFGDPVFACQVFLLGCRVCQDRRFSAGPSTRSQQ